MSTALPVAPKVRTLRCSGLDALFACTPAILADGPNVIRIGSNNDGAVVGKIVHDLAEGYVKRASFDIKNAVAAAGLKEADEEEIAKLMMYMMKGWDEIKQYFPQPLTEAVVKSDPLDVNGNLYQVQGTCDVLSPIGSTDAIFADYKSGFIDDAYHQQMAGYAYCIWSVMGKPDKCTITGVVMFLRHRYYRIVKFDADRLRQWEYDLTHNVIPSIDKYKPGKQCRYCDLYATCSARTAVVSGTINALMTPNGVQTGDPYLEFLANAKKLLAGLTVASKDDPIVAQTIADLMFKVKLCQQAIDDTLAMVRQAVQSVGGIPVGGGYQLALRKVEIDTVVPAKGMKTLRMHLSDAQIAESMRLSLPKLLTAYSASFGRGEKAKSKDKLYDALVDAGAISTSIQERMEEVEMSLPTGELNATGSPNP